MSLAEKFYSTTGEEFYYSPGSANTWVVVAAIHSCQWFVFSKLMTDFFWFCLNCSPLKPCLPPFILLHTNDADEAPDHTMGLEEKRSALTQSLVNIPKVIKISDFLDVQILIYTILAKKSWTKNKIWLKIEKLLKLFKTDRNVGKS